MIKFKLLFILKLPPPITGATVMNQRILISKKIRDMFETRYITVSYRDTIGTSDFPVKKTILFIRTISILLYQLVTYKPKLVYFQISPLGIPFIRDFILLSVLKIFRTKTLIHLRVYGIRERTRDSIFWHRIYQYAFRDNYLACHSDKMFFDVKDIYDETPYVITNGIENEVTDEEIKGKQNADHPTIIFLSNFLKSKGIEDILIACWKLKKEHVLFRLVVIGNYTDQISEKQLHRLIQRFDLHEEVELVGPVYGKEKYKRLLKSDIFAFPTKYEAFGNVAVEAMQAGLPVVSYKEGSLPLVIKDGKTGFVVEKGNIDRFSEKLKVLIEDSHIRNKMGLAGRKEYLTKYTIEKFEERLTIVLKSLVTGAE